MRSEGGRVANEKIGLCLVAGIRRAPGTVGAYKNRKKSIGEPANLSSAKVFLCDQKGKRS